MISTATATKTGVGTQTGQFRLRKLELRITNDFQLEGLMLLQENNNPRCMDQMVHEDPLKGRIYFKIRYLHGHQTSKLVSGLDMSKHPSLRQRPFHEKLDLLNFN